MSDLGQTKIANKYFVMAFFLVASLKDSNSSCEDNRIEMAVPDLLISRNVTYCGKSWIYIYLVFTKSVDRNFRAF